METKRTHQLGKIIPFHYNVNSLKKYKQVLKNNPRKVHNLYINFNDGKKMDEEWKVQTNKILFKILKKVKPLNQLDLSKAFRSNYSSKPKLIHLAKHQSRIKTLKFFFCIGSQVSPQEFTLWIKYCFNLKRLDWITPPVESDRTVLKKAGAKRLLKILKLQRLTSLSFVPKEAYDNKPKKRQNYRKNYRNQRNNREDEGDLFNQAIMKLYADWVESPIYLNRLPWATFDFSSLKRLKNLVLLISEKNPLWRSFFLKRPKLNHLESLELNIGPLLVSLPTESGWGQNFPLLRHVKLTFFSLPENEINVLIFMLDIAALSLRTFHLNTIFLRNEAFNVILILKCLRSFTNLENLSLKLFCNWPYQEENQIMNMLTVAISELNLKKLKLVFFQPSLRNRIIIPTKLLLKNCTQLEELTIKGNFLSSELFIEIMKESGNFCSTLRKLTIDNRSSCPEKKGVRTKFIREDFTLDSFAFQEICEIVGNYEKIHVLKLPNLLIDSDMKFHMIADSVLNLKHLKIFKLGRVEKDVNQVLMERLGDILSIPGLQIFKAKLDSNRFELFDKTFTDIFLSEIYSYISGTKTKTQEKLMNIGVENSEIKQKDFEEIISDAFKLNPKLNIREILQNFLKHPGSPMLREENLWERSNVARRGDYFS